MGPKTPPVQELAAGRNGTTPSNEGLLGTEGTLYAMPAPTPAAVSNTPTPATVTGIAAAVPMQGAHPGEAAPAADKDMGWASTMSLPAAAPPAAASPMPAASPTPAASPAVPPMAVTDAAFEHISSVLSVASLSQATVLPTVSGMPHGVSGPNLGTGTTRAFDPAALPPGSGTAFGRALRFAWHMLPAARRCKALLVPAGIALLLVVPLSLALGRRLDATDEEDRFYAVLLGGVAVLYPIVWMLCSALVPLLYEEVMGARADLGRAASRIGRSFGGLLVVALLSPVLALPAALARERRDGLGRLLGPPVEFFWTTATYALLPALLVERLPLGEALRRARALQREASAGMGPAVVGSESLALYAGLLLAGVGAYGLAFAGFYLGSEVHPILGAALVFAVAGLYWTFFSWLTMSYSTCFYLWVCECLRHGAPRRDLAPPPLRAAWGAL